MANNHTQVELKLFNLQKALAGASIAFGSGNVVSEYIHNFIDTKGVVEASRYRGESENGEVYYFDKNGLCSDGEMTHTLFMVETTETPTTGDTTAVTKCDEVEQVCKIVNITALNPREQIAVQAMQAIISTMSNPIAMDASTVTRLTKKSFDIAQSMLSAAAERRNAPTSDVNVNGSDVSSMTDKILYKIYETLENTGEDTPQQ